MDLHNKWGYRLYCMTKTHPLWKTPLHYLKTQTVWTEKGGVVLFLHSIAIRKKVAIGEGKRRKPNWPTCKIPKNNQSIVVLDKSDTWSLQSYIHPFQIAEWMICQYPLKD